MNLITPVKGFIQLCWQILWEVFSFTPVQVASISLFFYYGHHEYVLEATMMMIECVMHIVDHWYQYLEIVKVIAILGLIIYFTAYLILLARARVGNELIKIAADNEILAQRISCLTEQLEDSHSRIETLTNHRDSVLDDYSKQSIALELMRDRAEIAECRHTEAESNYQSDIDTIARLTEDAESYKRARDFMAGKFEHQANLLDRVNFWKKAAEVAEKDCSKNLVDHQNQETKLRKEVRTLRKEINRAGRQKIEDRKCIEGLEEDNKELNTKVNNIVQDKESAQSEHRKEAREISADRDRLQNELKKTQDELRDSEEQLAEYKEDTEERNKEMAKVKKINSTQEMELRDLKEKFAVAEAALKHFINNSRDDTGNNKIDQSNPEDGLGSSGEGRFDRKTSPSSSGSFGADHSDPKTSPKADRCGSDSSRAGQSDPKTSPGADGCNSGSGSSGVDQSDLKTSPGVDGSGTGSDLSGAGQPDSKTSSSADGSGFGSSDIESGSEKPEADENLPLNCRSDSSELNVDQSNPNNPPTESERPSAGQNDPELPSDSSKPDVSQLDINDSSSGTENPDIDHTDPPNPSSDPSKPDVDQLNTSNSTSQINNPSAGHTDPSTHPSDSSKPNVDQSNSNNPPNGSERPSASHNDSSDLPSDSSKPNIDQSDPSTPPSGIAKPDADHTDPSKPPSGSRKSKGSGYSWIGIESGRGRKEA